MAAILLAVTAVAGVALAAAPVAAQADGDDAAGTTAVALLRLTPSPRPLALGGAYAALASDPLALFYNPARLALAGGTHLSYASYPADVRAGALAGAWRTGPGGFGLGAQFLDLGTVEEMEPDPAYGGQRGRPTGREVSAGEVVLGAGYGASLGEGAHAGVAAKLLAVQIAGEAATGLAFDAGLSYGLMSDRLTVAAALQNLGGRMGPGQAAPLPTTLRVGTSARLVGGGEDVAIGPRATMAVDMLARDGGTTMAAGIEAGYALARDRAAVARIGYESRRRDVAGEPFVFGAGLEAGSFELNYAVRTLDALGETHHFGVSIGGLP